MFAKNSFYSLKNVFMESLRRVFSAFVLLFALLLMQGCSDQTAEEKGWDRLIEKGFSDADGNTYNLLNAGNLLWMADNLSVSQFRNGDPITHIQSNYGWYEASKNGVPAWRYPNDDPNLGAIYGKIYNGHAVTDPRGLAPEGWRIPDSDDWQQLFNHVMGSNIEPAVNVSTLKGEDNSLRGEFMRYIWNDAAGKLKEYETVTDKGFGILYAGQIDAYGNFYDFDERLWWWVVPSHEPFSSGFEGYANDLGKIGISKESATISMSAAWAHMGFQVRLVSE